MRKKEYLIALTICTVLTCGIPVVHAADMQDFKPVIEKTANIQEETILENDSMYVPSGEKNTVNSTDSVNSDIQVSPLESDGIDNNSPDEIEIIPDSPKDENETDFEKFESWNPNNTTALESGRTNEFYASEFEEQIENSFDTISIEEYSEERYVVDLTNGNTLLSKETMKNLMELNQSRDIAIHTSDGVIFTFLKNSMRMIDGKDEYDFGVELISNLSESGIEIPNENFVFRIKYNNTGELPGTAQVSIPVGNQWSGQEVCYSVINDAGILYMATEIVDGNGVYTIPELTFTLGL